MKRKLFLIVSLCMLMFGLTACGADPKTVDYNGVTYDQLQTASGNLASSLIDLTDEDIEYAAQNSDEVTAKLVERWAELKPEIGTYIGTGSFSASKSGKTVTTSLVMDFSGRDITLSCVYDYTDMSISDITLDEIYTMGETMQKAAMNTVMGLGTVFSILILISLIIWGFKLISYVQGRGKKAPQPGQPVQQQPVPRAAAPVPQPAAAVPAERAEQDDLELIAVIAAAVAAASGAGTDDFVVRSIRRRK